MSGGKGQGAETIGTQVRAGNRPTERGIVDQPDPAALKKALPDVAARFMKSTTSRRFCVA